MPQEPAIIRPIRETIPTTRRISRRCARIVGVLLSATPDSTQRKPKAAANSDTWQSRAKLANHPCLSSLLASKIGAPSIKEGLDVSGWRTRNQWDESAHRWAMHFSSSINTSVRNFPRMPRQTKRGEEHRAWWLVILACDRNWRVRTHQCARILLEV